MGALSVTKRLVALPPRLEKGTTEREGPRVWSYMASGIPSSPEVLLAYFRKPCHQIINKT